MAWDRPKTIKLYLQAPASDRLITLWPDGKVVDQQATAPPGEQQEACGVHFLFGPEARAVDWEASRWRVRADGIPVHVLRCSLGTVRVELEAFCPWESPAVTCLKVTVTNESTKAQEFTLGVLPRTGAAHHLWGIVADFYGSYRPAQGLWDMVRNSWTPGEGELTDGERRLAYRLPEGCEAQWRERPRTGHLAHYYLEAALRLGTGSSRALYFTLGRGEAVTAGAEDYDRRLAETVARWQQELAPVRLRPAVPDTETHEIFHSLVCQCLQMLATDHEGRLRPRQGGGCPHVWPWEAAEWLPALDRVGLGKWTRPAYAFFRAHQETAGEDRGRCNAVGAPNWFGHTGGVLRGLGLHLVSEGSREYFGEWRASALAALEWVERQREKTRTEAFDLGRGLLPPGEGHDWGVSGQYWCFSDGITFMGVREMARAFDHFGDPEAERLTAASRDYRQCLARTLQSVVEAAGEGEELFVPNVLGVEESYPPGGPYFVDGPVNLMRAGILDPKSEVFERVESYFQNRGWMQNGLNGLMTDGLFLWRGSNVDPWAGHTWYVSTGDMCWFYAWLERGEKTKAARTLRAQLLYGMTPEHYMAERYADNDPSFCPWQPNASANGRTIQMLLDYFGEERA